MYLSQLRQRAVILLVILSLPLAMVGCTGQSQKQANSQEPPSQGNPNIDAPVYDLQQTLKNREVDAVGFDLDDTLLFSTPAFNQGFNKAKEPFSPEFWKIVNRSDEGRSCVKPKTLKLLKRHRKLGHEIYVITARSRHNTDILKKYVSSKFNIPTDHVFLEPNGKTTRLEKLGIDIYYGDSDSDIKDAQKANIKAVRILRSPESGYDDKHNPGKYNEPYVPNSAPPHGCSKK